MQTCVTQTETEPVSEQLAMQADRQADRYSKWARRSSSLSLTCEGDGSGQPKDGLLALLRLRLGGRGSDGWALLALDGQGVLLERAQRNGRGARGERSASCCGGQSHRTWKAEDGKEKTNTREKKERKLVWRPPGP